MGPATRARRGASAATNRDAAPDVPAPEPAGRRGRPAAKAAGAGTPGTNRDHAAGGDDQAAAAAGNSGAASDAEQLSDGLTALERERAAILARNRARMAELGIPEAVAGLAALTGPAKATRPPAHKGVSRKRKTELVLPPRVSLRSRGEAPEFGMVLHEGRDGRVVTSGGSAAAAAAAVAKGPPPKGAPAPDGDMGFVSFSGSTASDAAFLALLRRQVGSQAGGGRAAAGSGGPALMRFPLAGDDVAKMTKGATTCLSWHPCSGAYPLIASGDKYGSVALWAVDFDAARDCFDAADDASSKREGEGGAGGSEGSGAEGPQPSASIGSSDGEEGDDAFDGILAFTPHEQYISALRWLGAGAGAKLLSASYDGRARLLDVHKGEFQLVPGLSGIEDAEWSAADGDGEAHTVYLATPLGDGAIADVRAAKAVATGLHLHERKINTLALAADGRHMASSCSDGSIKLWDVRKLAEGGGRKPAPVAALAHPKSSQGAVWAPDASDRLLSVSFDDTLRVWGPPPGAGAAGLSKMGQRLSVRHDNQTGRWVIPFRPCWWGPDAFLVGDMKRGVAVFDAATGRQHGLLQAEALTAIPSRLAPWGAAPGGSEAGPAMLAAATNSGRVHIFRA